MAPADNMVKQNRLPPEVADVVREWLQHHRNEECSEVSKRLLAKKMLMHQSVRDLKKTPEQMLNTVSNTQQQAACCSPY